jgi:hypothetical protein
MAPKRLITAATLLGIAFILASCGSFVADHWPHWAGGIPADAPPRPGAPGYAEFIAHGRPIPDAKQQPAAAVPSGVQAPGAPAPVATSPAATSPAAAAPPTMPAGDAAPDDGALQDSSVVKGGLY